LERREKKKNECRRDEESTDEGTKRNAVTEEKVGIESKM